MQPCRLPFPFHSRFYSSFYQWIDGRTLFPSHIWKQSFFAPFVLIPAIIFLIVAFYLFLRKFFPACLPYVANDRITHVPKKN